MAAGLIGESLESVLLRVEAVRRPEREPVLIQHQETEVLSVREIVRRA